MRTIEIQFEDLGLIKQRIYNLSKQFDVFQICDSNAFKAALAIGRYELVAGFGSKGDSISELENIQKSYDSEWRFGLIQYPERSNQIFGPIRFFTPELVLCIDSGSKFLKMIVQSDNLDLGHIEKQLTDSEMHTVTPTAHPEFAFTPQTSFDQYIQTVNKIRDDIRNGKYYEMNYCIEFTAQWDGGDLLPYMCRLNDRTAAPFSIYAKMDDLEILCSSPERFLYKDSEKLISQPIKGTNALMPGPDNHLQLQKLKASEKERAENVMIVDLVRNDLSKVCEAGSIKVDELFGTYAFKSLNHMISTVSGKLSPGTNLKGIMEGLFPMGSMTGAPKLEVMKHIELYENMSRGVYSGCMGYLDPNGNFDFNVMIRTLVFNHSNHIINYKVGSAITFDSVAEHEYEECLLKGHRLESLFID